MKFVYVNNESDWCDQNIARESYYQANTFCSSTIIILCNTIFVKHRIDRSGRNVRAVEWKRAFSLIKLDQFYFFFVAQFELGHFHFIHLDKKYTLHCVCICFHVFFRRRQIFSLILIGREKNDCQKMLQRVATRRNLLKTRFSEENFARNVQFFLELFAALHEKFSWLDGEIFWCACNAARCIACA